MLLRPHQWVRGRWPWGYGSVFITVMHVVTRLVVLFPVLPTRTDSSAYLYGFGVVCTDVRELCSIIRKSASVDLVTKMVFLQCKLCTGRALVFVI